jgi:hypothetical protein
VAAVLAAPLVSGHGQTVNRPLIQKTEFLIVAGFDASGDLTNAKIRRLSVHLTRKSPLGGFVSYRCNHRCYNGVGTGGRIARSRHVVFQRTHMSPGDLTRRSRVLIRAIKDKVGTYVKYAFKIRGDEVVAHRVAQGCIEGGATQPAHDLRKCL